MKALIFVGPAETGKTRIASLIHAQQPNSVFILARGKRILSSFAYDSVTPETKTLILDDVPKDFDYSILTATQKTEHPWSIKFLITVEKKRQKPFVVEIDNLIITTNGIDKKLFDRGFMKACFDVIYLSKDIQ